MKLGKLLLDTSFAAVLSECKNNALYTCACYPVPAECIFIRKLRFRLEGFLRARIQHQDPCPLCPDSGAGALVQIHQCWVPDRPHTPRTDRKLSAHILAHSCEFRMSSRHQTENIFLCFDCSLTHVRAPSNRGHILCFEPCVCACPRAVKRRSIPLL